MCKQIKNLIIDIQIFIKGECECEWYEDVYLVEENSNHLSIHYCDDKTLLQTTYPMSNIDYYKITKDIEYWEDDEEEDDND